MIVVDASAIADVLTKPDETGDLRERLALEDLNAPHLIDYEVLSVLRGLVLGGALSAARAEDALTDFADLALERWPAYGALRRRAFALRDNLSAYDAAYVVLAESLDCALVTRDERLSRAARSLIHVEVL